MEVIVPDEASPLLGNTSQRSGLSEHSQQSSDISGSSRPRDEETVASFPEWPEEPEPTTQPEFAGILSTLLIGVFIANADSTLVLATYGEISSEFQRLESASWLVTGYMLTMCASQPLYGKLSNVYGRKALLLCAYVFFAAGSLLCGIGTSMLAVIVGRVIAGAGGAGMSSVVSFLIADMVPVRDVAAYRSYVNTVQTIGRSCGGPVGGWLAHNIGWRWSFLVQVPATMFALILVGWRLNVPVKKFEASANSSPPSNRLARIDFLGASLLFTMIVSFLAPLSMGGNQLPWDGALIWVLFAVSFLTSMAFIYVERSVASEPIFVLSLLARRNVALSYLILFLQNMAQTIMMYVVPLYFQVTNSASAEAAGFHLVPAVVGNTIGGLAAGAYIKRSGNYKLPTLLGASTAVLCHALTSGLWTGHTSWIEALYVVPGGLGTGLAHSSTFMAMASATNDEELAIAGGGLFLSGNFGSLIGATLSSSAIRMVVSAVAKRKLPNHPGVVEKALADVHYIVLLKGKVREAIVDAYVTGFRASFGVALLACSISLVVGLGLKAKRL